MTRINSPENSIKEGHVKDKTLMTQLSTDLAQNWDTKFSWKNFPTFKFFGNEWIDDKKNRQIQSHHLGKRKSRFRQSTN